MIIRKDLIPGGTSNPRVRPSGPAFGPRLLVEKKTLDCQNWSNRLAQLGLRENRPSEDRIAGGDKASAPFSVTVTGLPLVIVLSPNLRRS